MEHVLITGGAGYIGSLLAPMLLESGYRVTIFDSFLFGAGSLLGFSRHPNLEIVEGDVREPTAVSRAVRGKDWILHLAAIVGYPACAADPIRASTTNVDGTRNVVDAMENGQRLVFASTGSTYGKVQGVADEETPIAPLTLYGKTKWEGERIIREGEVKHTSLRFATVFGTSPRLRLDLLVNDFVHQAIHSKQIVLFEGHFRRTFLHSTDAAAVYPLALEAFDRMDGQVFNVGDETMNYTKREVALRIREHVDYYLHEADIGTDPDQRDYEVDYGRIRSLGYEAHVTLDEGIRELVRILSVLRVRDPLRNA
ncbi:MAG: NAD-dependent epimerase/dehydratase family protein [Planctomycetota bacterium]|jgi:nucleoside-diphosphate-sugar epimerase